MAKGQQQSIDYSGTDFWQQFSDSLDKDRKHIYVKDQPVMVRLVHQVTSLPPVEPVFSTYMGNETKQYMLHAIELDEMKEGNPTVKGLVLKTKAMKEVTRLITEGYDLFSASEGHALKIVRQGQGRDQKYIVTPSPKASPLTEAALDALEEATPLRELAEEHTKRSRDRAEGNNDNTPPF